MIDEKEKLAIDTINDSFKVLEKTVEIIAQTRDIARHEMQRFQSVDAAKTEYWTAMYAAWQNMLEALEAASRKNAVDTFAAEVNAAKTRRKPRKGNK
jgi:hypothetical protein